MILSNNIIYTCHLDTFLKQDLTVTGKYARLAYARPLRYHDERLLAWARFALPDASQLGGFLASSFIFDSHAARNSRFSEKIHEN